VTPYHRAVLAVEQTPDEDLRRRLHEAVELLWECAAAADLDCKDSDMAPLEGLPERVGELMAEVREAEQRADEAEGRLEAHLQDRPDVTVREDLQTARVQLLSARQEVVELRAKVTAQEELPEELRSAVGDVLAMSRKLVTVCEKAGIKPVHVRRAR